jgi:hypothetical protein
MRLLGLLLSTPFRTDAEYAVLYRDFDITIGVDARQLGADHMRAILFEFLHGDLL